MTSRTIDAAAPASQTVTTERGTTTTSTTAPEVSTTERVAATTTTAAAPPVQQQPVSLGALQIDDQPHDTSGYRRDEWPTWKDVDGDGCDARDQALRAASNPPAVTVGRCQVVSGTWRSAYDEKVLTATDQVDIDHVVPLEEAYRSGGWQWSTDQRALYANDQADLWVVSSSSNRSKGARAPDQWRPPSHTVWCEYATRWVAIKVRWNLTATTSERDALGQMLDTCDGASTTSAPAPPTTTASPPPTMQELPTTSTPPPAAAPYYANCAAARAAGVTPIRRGDPGYRDALDGDHDGIACEK